MTLQWETRGPEPTCGAQSPGGRMRCEYPPDHRVGVDGEVANHHLGRDAMGRWRSWPVHILDDVWEKEMG